MRHCALLLIVFSLRNAVAYGDEAERSSTSAAAEKALALVARSAGIYAENRQCFSCHHQALPIVALRLAEACGLAIDSAEAARQAAFIVEHFHGRATAVAEGKRVDGGPYAAGYALVALAADRAVDDDKTSRTIQALVDYLRRMQESDGSWRIRSHRPPLEDSDFTATALAVRSLGLFADTDDDDARERIGRGGRWLRDSAPSSTEDRVFRLFGLRWASMSKADVTEAADELRSTQRNDGGWGQLEELSSDAYATGQALVALRLAGDTSLDDPCYATGMRWLLEHRQDDGSWQVTTRAKPFQTYFESGFPHEKSQFIAIAGTCWAAMALTLAEPVDDGDSVSTPLRSGFVVSQPMVHSPAVARPVADP